MGQRTLAGGVPCRFDAPLVVIPPNSGIVFDRARSNVPPMSNSELPPLSRGCHTLPSPCPVAGNGQGRIDMDTTTISVGPLPQLSPGRDLLKTPTGIRGLDEITRGGLPKGRPTLVCGGPGSGKTLLALTFLVNGAVRFDEPGVLLTFEENADEIAHDVASLGFDLPALIAANKLAVDYVHVERSEIEETGEYDLEGLFVRLDYAIRRVGAKRVVLDTIESLFAGLSNDGILRAELRRLFRWLKDQGVSAIITGERGDGLLTRQGLEEYVSDAVILLDHRVHDQVSTRRLRVVKYRGTYHGTNEYP